MADYMPKCLKREITTTKTG